MCTVFKAAVTAVLVVDHFHLLQLANAVIDEVRCRLTAQIRGGRGRSGDGNGTGGAGSGPSSAPGGGRPA
ncbi:transposase [Amycolatopsis sp. NPDC051371]|uniref:transposase n=1 Tax=Amycolatopsis sp. NPDC051371 TaxID=3155800 RepID=UPI003414588A